MLHVFPEVDSKHSESEWNQDSDTVTQFIKMKINFPENFFNYLAFQCLRIFYK